MDKYIKLLRELIDDFDNKKINDCDLLNEIFNIIYSMEKELTFEAKIKKLIKNYDDYFNSNFDKEIKNDIINLFKNDIIFYKELLPQRISIKKEKISMMKKEFNNFVDKLGFNENKILETSEDIYYIWRYK